jgi:outer membrane protein assembly factor BamA
MGNTQTATSVILNVVRTKPGDLFDPQTVEEDYQRIYGMKRFGNVEAKAEPTETGVIVTFIVTEQKQIKEIRFHGNKKVDTEGLKNTIDIRPGEAIDAFRISIARQAIESLYKSKNYPYAHVGIDRDKLAASGILVFEIVEGPQVKVRKVDFTGNKSFSDDRLRDEVHTKYWIWIFRPGTFDPDTVDDDVALLRHFYEGKGFFDCRVGRKITESPNQTEIKVTYLIEEGVRYTVDKIIFRGNKSISSQALQSKLKLGQGRYFDVDTLHRDVREVVRAYSPYGMIYVPNSNNPDYLRIGDPMYPFGIATIFHRDAGKVDLLFDIKEGKPFKLGRIIVKGNTRTQDKVVLREMRMAPGQKYDSAQMNDASDRLKNGPYFSNVTMTPIGEDPNVRDLVVNVTEARTATFGVGAGINSNGGLGGNLTYEQRNFDIFNFPDSPSDIFSDRAFVGAGQNLRISLEPGTEASNASIRFSEPWLFDQPYSFTAEAYYRDREREDWEETRAGGRLTFGKRFNYIYSTSLTLRAEDVKIHSLGDDADQCEEIDSLRGHNTLTSTILQLRRDTTNHGALPDRGTSSTVAWESYGTMGGEFTFQKFSGSLDYYKTLNEDLLDRKTILALRGDAGWIWGTSPFFERFYGGGIGTIRGFKFRGVSPRCEDAPGDLPIGGDFSLTGTCEVGFPLYGDNLRGVVFCDAGTVEDELEIGTIRSSVGFGFRLTLPIFGHAPIALDFAAPLSKNSEDDTQWFSFSLGIVP